MGIETHKKENSTSFLASRTHKGHQKGTLCCLLFAVAFPVCSLFFREAGFGRGASFRGGTDKVDGERMGGLKTGEGLGLLLRQKGGARRERPCLLLTGIQCNDEIWSRK